MEHNKKEDMNIVIVGHVDHGKSTLMGRLLADTDSLPQGKLDQVRETCRRNSKPFEYAFLLDALKDEQSQGITIDTARCFFKTDKRDYIILDAPGHIEFLKNMITGAARAEAAILVIDAKEGVQENSRRHGYMLSMLGIKQIAVAINKMDLVDYQEDVFEKVKTEYVDFLKQIDIEPKTVLPISSYEGENLTSHSSKMPWYKGMNVLEVLDAFECEKMREDLDFRMYVQDVYKFTKDGDDRRIIAGTVDSGSIRVGDEIVFYPSGKRSHVKSIEAFHSPTKDAVSAGTATGITMQEQIYVKRGEILSVAGQKKPKTGSRMSVNLFWLGKKSFRKDKSYFLKIGSEKVRVELDEVTGVLDSSNLTASQKDSVGKNEVAECVLRMERPIAFDLVANNAATSRFVIVDQYEIAGGGIITKVLTDEQSTILERVHLRNYKWEYSQISQERRAERYSQKPILVLLTGENNVGKKELAKAFEKRLLDDGRFVYYLGIGTFLYGVGSDIKSKEREDNEERIRRFAEVVNLMLDAGLIVIVTARNLTARDLSIMKTVINCELETVWVGENKTTDIKTDLNIKDASNPDNLVLLKDRLKKKEIMFRG